MRGPGVAINAWQRAGTVVVNVFVLNLLFITCSIPLITLPPSLAAVFGTVRIWSETADERVVSVYFSEWRRLAWRSYAVFVPALLVAAILAIELRYYAFRRDFISVVMFGLTIGFALIFLSISAYLGPVLATGHLSPKRVIQTSALLGISRWLRTMGTVVPLGFATVLFSMWLPASIFAGLLSVACWLLYLSLRPTLV